MDLKIINFIKMINNKENEKIPEPNYFTISTQSAMCNIDNINNIDLSKTVVVIARNIINKIILKQDLNYLIRGIVLENLILRFDESYLKKYKKPYIKYMNKLIDYNDVEGCLFMLNDIQSLESNSLKKHGRQKKKKDNEHFYNSCSIIVKASLEIKCVNIKLFNNGKITLTGSKEESDGYFSACVLLEEMKKCLDVFPDNNEEEIKNLQIVNYRITMINSDFNTNFRVDLLKLLNILNTSEKNLFTKFNPEKYRGLIVGFYWNTNKEYQDGICNCNIKCNGKGCGTGNGSCKKITISIFKSGSVIITGGRLTLQIDDAYKLINIIFKKYYYSIVKLSILDYINIINVDEVHDKKINVKKINNKKENDDHKDNNEERIINVKNINKVNKIKILRFKKNNL